MGALKGGRVSGYGANCGPGGSCFDLQNSHLFNVYENKLTEMSFLIITIGHYSRIKRVKIYKIFCLPPLLQVQFDVVDAKSTKSPTSDDCVVVVVSAPTDCQRRRRE